MKAPGLDFLTILLERIGQQFFGKSDVARGQLITGHRKSNTGYRNKVAGETVVEIPLV